MHLVNCPFRRLCCLGFYLCEFFEDGMENSFKTHLNSLLTHALGHQPDLFHQIKNMGHTSNVDYRCKFHKNCELFSKAVTYLSLVPRINQGEKVKYILPLPHVGFLFLHVYFVPKTVPQGSTLCRSRPLPGLSPANSWNF